MYFISNWEMHSIYCLNRGLSGFGIRYSNMQARDLPLQWYNTLPYTKIVEGLNTSVYIVKSLAPKK